MSSRVFRIVMLFNHFYFILYDLTKNKIDAANFSEHIFILFGSNEVLVEGLVSSRVFGIVMLSNHFYLILYDLTKKKMMAPIFLSTFSYFLAQMKYDVINPQ